MSGALSTSHNPRDPSVSPPPSTLLLLKQILLKSLYTILENPKSFLLIFLLTTLPLSLTLFSLSLSSHPIKSHVYNLESLASLAPTRFEARQVWKESRDDAVSLLLRIKLLHFLPSYFLSLLAAVSAVTTTLSHSLLPSLTRPFATSVVVYALLFAYALLTRVILTAFATGSGFVIRVIGSCLEIYVMEVAALSIVVSIAEERFGLEAIWVGSGLMKGRRVCGWALSGLLVILTAGIAERVEEEMMDGEDLMEGSSMGTMRRVVVGIGGKFGWVVLYGVVVLWGFVVTSVFYCECRNRHVAVVDGENENDSV